MRFERNAACPCGSEVKFKRCCGRDRESQRVLEERIETMAEIVGIAALTPLLRPDSPAFDAWAERLGTMPDEPRQDVLAAGVEALGEDERARILADCVDICGDLWRGASAELGDDGLARTLLLQGAVRAGLHERLPVPAPFYRDVEEHLEVCANPLCPLSLVVNPSDVWGLIEAVEIDDEAEGDSDLIDELGHARWTTAHDRRLDLVLGRLHAELPAAPPVARAALEDGLAALARDPALRADLAVVLLEQAIELFDEIADAA